MNAHHNHARTRGDESTRSATAERFGIFKRVGIAIALLCSSLLFITPVAHAVPVATGPVDPATNFPTYYGDAAGLKLQPCLDGLPMCSATPADLVAPDGEFFYNLVAGEAGPFLITLALEGAYIDAGTGQEIAFNRVRISAPKGGLTPGAQYTIVHPYGQVTRTANSTGTIPNNAGTTDTGCLAAPCDFTRAIGGAYTGFLTWDTFGMAPAAGGPPAGYVGDAATPHLITGSPLNQNFVAIYEGPSATGTPLWSTNQFTVEGKVAAGPALAVSPPTLDFGNQVVGAAVTRTATVTSKGVDPLTFDALAPFTFSGPNAAEFSVADTGTCTSATSLPTLSTCTVDVSYVPQSSAASATLTLNTNAGPETIALSGQSTPLAQTNVASLSYAAQRLFTNSGSKTVTLKNTGGAPLVLQGISIAPNDPDTPVDFSVDPATQSCFNETVLAPGATCKVDVIFNPQTDGARGAVLRFSDNAASSPQQVTLSGTGTVAAFQSDVISWTFAGQATGTTSPSKAITVKNVGSDTLTIGDVAIGGTNPGDFAEVDACAGLTLPINGTCTVQVTFSPTTTGTRRASLDVTDNAPQVGTVHRILLAGSGLDNTAPGVAVTAPAAGATVSGNAVAVSASASDNVGVVGVQFQLDGVSLGAEDTTAPYSITWDTTSGQNGPATLTAVARDAAGNQTTSGARSVTVNNVVVDATGPTVSLSAPAAGATVSGSAVAVSATASDNVGVVGVQFFDGTTAIGAEDTTSPYSVSWNTTAAANGLHSLTAVARDAAGNRATSAARSVTVSNAAADTTPPTVAVTPKANATIVPQTVNLTATFSEPVTGVNTTSFTLRNAATNAAIAGTVTYNATTRVATFDPTPTLSADTKYTATLTSSIRDGAGNALTATSWTFLTGPRPTVTVSPANSATGVSRTANMTATFNENVTGVNGTNFVLRTASTGALVTAVVSYNSTTRVATLNPSPTLTANTRYSVTLSANIKDVAGNPIAATTWSFTTGA